MSELKRKDYRGKVYNQTQQALKSPIIPLEGFQLQDYHQSVQICFCDFPKTNELNSDGVSLFLNKNCNK